MYIDARNTRSANASQVWVPLSVSWADAEDDSDDGETDDEAQKP